MYYSPAILGHSIVTELTKRQRLAILTIGKDTFDRDALAGVHCYHFMAAVNLSRILNQELKVKDTRDVFNTVPPERLVLPRLGAISLAVLGAAFEAKGIGGSAPLDAWCEKHRGALITFATLKHQDAKRDAPKPRTRRRGFRSRRPSPKDHVNG